MSTCINIGFQGKSWKYIIVSKARRGILLPLSILFFLSYFKCKLDFKCKACLAEERKNMLFAFSRKKI